MRKLLKLMKNTKSPFISIGLSNFLGCFSLLTLFTIGSETFLDCYLTRPGVENFDSSECVRCLRVFVTHDNEMPGFNADRGAAFEQFQPKVYHLFWPSNLYIINHYPLNKTSKLIIWNHMKDCTRFCFFAYVVMTSMKCRPKVDVRKCVCTVSATCLTWQQRAWIQCRSIGHVWT